jgi:hypothetical protein
MIEVFDVARVINEENSFFGKEGVVSKIDNRDKTFSLWLHDHSNGWSDVWFNQDELEFVR